MAKIDHLGIAVNSIEQARRLYEVLGLTVLEQEEEDEGNAQRDDSAGREPPAPARTVG